MLHCFSGKTHLVTDCLPGTIKHVCPWLFKSSRRCYNYCPTGHIPIFHKPNELQHQFRFSSDMTHYFNQFHYSEMKTLFRNNQQLLYAYIYYMHILWHKNQRTSAELKTVPRNCYMVRMTAYWEAKKITEKEPYLGV